MQLVAKTSLCMVLGCSLFACQNAGESCDLETREIVMRASVIDDALGIVAELELTSADFGSLTLCEADGDELTINGQKPQSVGTPTGGYFYNVSFDTAPDEYEFVYTRPKRDETIVATVEPPPDFALAAPEQDSEHSRAVELLVEWEPAAEGEIVMTIADELGYDCLEPPESVPPLPDEGTAVLLAGTLVEGADAPEDGACSVDIELLRERMGEYPDALASGGRIEALVKRHVRFLSLP